MKTLKIFNTALLALVDDDDFDRCCVLRWTLSSKGYPKHATLGRLHNYLLGPTPEGLVPDHKNRNKLDNQRHNLRFITPSANSVNKITPNGVDRNLYLDVAAIHRPWRVCFRRNHRLINVGNYATKEEARVVRDAWLSKFT